MIRRDLFLAGGSVLGLSWAYAFLVPAGLPYDEPSHWQNVVHIATDRSLPVVGEPDVSYEAVQGPLAYVVDALALVMLEGLGLDRDQAFVGVRMAQCLWLVVLLFLFVGIVRRVLPDLPNRAAVVSSAAVAGSPILIAIGSSVQNDVPALVFASGAVFVFIGEDECPRNSIVVGLLLGVAFLVKASVWPVGVVLVLVVVARRRWVDGVLLVASGVAVSGWWVMRNVVLYGSLTGNNAVEASGTNFPPVGFDGPSTVVDLLRSAATFLWVPVEYWRNEIDAPLVVGAAVVVATLVGLATGSRRLQGTETRGLATLITIAVLSILVWAFVNVLVANASFRIAYAALGCWVVLLAAGLGRHRFGRLAMLAFTLSLHAWTLIALEAVAFEPLML